MTISKRKMLPVIARAAKEMASRSAASAEWWEHRTALGEWKTFLVTMSMYTDDPCILCLGPGMTYEALQVWNWMASGSRTMMVIMQQSPLGMSLSWDEKWTWNHPFSITCLLHLYLPIIIMDHIPALWKI